MISEADLLARAAKLTGHTLTDDALVGGLVCADCGVHVDVYEQIFDLDPCPLEHEY